MKEIVTKIHQLDSFPFFCVYMLMVLLMGQWKKYTKPLELREILAVYNLSVCALNLFTAISFFHGMYYSESLFDMRPSEFMKPAFKVHWFLKTIKLLDTVVLILRHKQHQIIFYHVLNHSSLLVMSDYIFHFYPCTALAWFATPICIGHTLWHLYLGLHAVYHGNPPPWKKAFRYFDIIEFTIHFIHAAIGYYYNYYCMYNVFYTLTILCLFCREHYNYLMNSKCEKKD